MPPVEFILTVDAAYFVAAFFVSIALSVLGIGKVSKILIKILLIVSFGIMGLGVLSMAQKAEKAEDLKRQIDTLHKVATGGNNFAYFTAEPNTAPNGENYLTITTTGQMPLFDCSMRFLSPNGEANGSREWSFRPLPKTTARFSFTTLPPGRYRADCVMGEELWSQHLEFERVPTGIDQIYWVEKDNQIVKEGP